MVISIKYPSNMGIILFNPILFQDKRVSFSVVLLYCGADLGLNDFIESFYFLTLNTLLKPKQGQLKPSQASGSPADKESSVAKR